MIKSILVPLAGTPSDRVALDMARAVGGLFAGHIDALHVQQDPVRIALETSGFDMGTGATVLTPNLIETLQRDVAKTASVARRMFDEACRDIAIVSQPGASGVVSACYSELEGEPARDVAAAARTHELTVFALPETFTGLGPGGIGEVLVRCGRPVLVASTEIPRTFARSVAIAWKDTAEAARALTAALPLLAVAQRIAILVAPEDEREDDAVSSANRVCAELQWHGLSPDVRVVDPAGDPPGAIVDGARNFGADLLVMGGYGHSRAREFILGGFTRFILEGAPLPVLLAH